MDYTCKIGSVALARKFDSKTHRRLQRPELILGTGGVRPGDYQFVFAYHGPHVTWLDFET